MNKISRLSISLALALFMVGPSISAMQYYENEGYSEDATELDMKAYDDMMETSELPNFDDEYENATSYGESCNQFSPHHKYFFKIYDNESDKHYKIAAKKTVVLRVFRGQVYEPAIYSFKHNTPCSKCEARYRVSSDYTKEIHFPNGGHFTIEAPEQQFSSICVGLSQK